VRFNNLNYEEISSSKTYGSGYSILATYSKKRSFKKSILFLFSIPLTYLFLLHHDQDGDGLSDLDEMIKYRTNLFSRDTDNDGFTDYEEVYGKVIYIFKNEKFLKTGNEPKYVKTHLPDASWRKVEVEFEATSMDDKWDRFYSIFLTDKNGKIELHRGITPLIKPNEFPNSIKSVEDITPYASLLKGEREFGTFITSYVGEWDVTVKLRLFPGEENAPDKVLPVFYMEAVTGKSESREINIPEFKKLFINLHVTGHGFEEYTGRDVVIKADGKEIVRTYVGNLYFGNIRGGWNPGQGTVSPIRIDISNDITPGTHEITVEIPGSKQYWNVSLSLFLDE
jgi:hypothetical protein